MAFRRLEHIGICVNDLQDACERFERLFGLKARDFRNDQSKGMQYDARILLGNECWLHLVQNWNPDSRVTSFVQERGEGLDHIALQTDDIEADVAHLREIGVPIFQDKIFPANDGYEAFVFPDQLPGLTVELIQPHETSWIYPEDAVGERVSDRMGIIRLQHVGLVVRDLLDACQRFEQLFGLKACDFRDDQGKEMQYDARILLGNECWLHLVQSWDPEARVTEFLQSRGEGLEHIALQTKEIESDVEYLRSIGTPIFQDNVFHANDGFEAFVYPDQLPGLTVQLIQPHATSWTYPEEEPLATVQATGVE